METLSEKLMTSQTTRKGFQFLPKPKGKFSDEAKLRAPETERMTDKGIKRCALATQVMSKERQNRGGRYRDARVTSQKSRVPKLGTTELMQSMNKGECENHSGKWTID